jgi:hypothetical protein
MAFCVGVEEAFHVYQYVTNPEKHQQFSEQADQLGISNRSKEYDFLPIEYEAMQIVHQAMIDTGIVHTAPLMVSHVTPEEAEWAAPYLRDRTVPKPPSATNTIQPFTRGVVTISADGTVTRHETPALSSER